MFVLDIPEVAGNVLSPLRLGPQKVVNPARSQEPATEQTRGKYPPVYTCIIGWTDHSKAKMSFSITIDWRVGDATKLLKSYFAFKCMVISRTGSLQF